MRALRIVIALGLGATFALAAPCPASAQGKKPDAATLAEAKRLFDEGAELYSKGSYEQAIEQWEISFELSKKPLIYESIANAYERLGDEKKAREYLAKWRAAAPREEHGLLDARLANLDARIVKEQQEIDAREAEEEKQRAAAKVEGPREGPAPEGGTSVPGLVLIGAGVGAVAVGVTLDLVAAAGRPDAASACKGAGDRQVCLASQQDAIESSNTLATIGDVLWIAGSVAALGGIVLVLTHEPDAPAASSGARSSQGVRAAVSPWMTGESGGLSLGGTF